MENEAESQRAQRPRGGADLLAKHIVVQLQLVEPLQLFGQPVVTLPKLLDVVAGLGQDPAFTLQEKPTGRGLEPKTPACFPKAAHARGLVPPEAPQRLEEPAAACAHRTQRVGAHPPWAAPDLARLGALHGAVWDDLGQLHDPVVDLVPAAPLHCGGSEDRVAQESATQAQGQ